MVSVREAVEQGVVLERDDLLVVDPHLDGRHQVLVLRDDVISEVRGYVSRAAAFEAVEGRPW